MPLSASPVVATRVHSEQPRRQHLEEALSQLVTHAGELDPLSSQAGLQ